MTLTFEPLSNAPKPVRLTHFSKASGCGCKIAPAVLHEITKGLSAEGERLLVGFSTGDDAAAFDLGNGRALLQTVDFFSPVVDDAFTFGKIAAANSISDIYAMGGRPFGALAVLGWPSEKIPASLAREVMQGALSICKEAGVILAGGHTIDSAEPFFGLSVSGEIASAHIKRNSTAKDGDLIFLTKPVGTGMLAAACKRDVITASEIEDAIKSMCTLNVAGMRLAEWEQVHAVTDVTGFGLLGHLLEMCDGAGLKAVVHYDRIPVFNKVKELCAAFVYADNTMRNWKAYGEKTLGVDGEKLLVLCDPQTNGGLLIAVDPDGEKIFLNAFPEAVNIGRFVAGNGVEMMS